MHAWIDARQRHRRSHAEVQTVREVGLIQSRERSALARRRRSGLGRILRPQWDGRVAHFFTPVARDTREEESARHGKLFLTEQVHSHQVRLVGRI